MGQNGVRGRGRHVRGTVQAVLGKWIWVRWSRAMQPDGDAVRVEAEDATLEAPEAMADIQAERCDVDLDVTNASSEHTRTDLRQADGRVGTPRHRMHSLRRRGVAPSAKRPRV